MGGAQQSECPVAAPSWSGLCPDMLLTVRRPPGANQAGERGLLWGMEDLSSALRAQALPQGTGHL